MVATAGSPAAPSGLASLVLATGHTTKRQREKTARNRLSRTINPFRRCNAVLVEEKERPDSAKMGLAFSRIWERMFGKKEMRILMVDTCVEIKILRRVRAESPRRPPRHRRAACSMAWRCRFLAARPSQKKPHHRREVT